MILGAPNPNPVLAATVVEGREPKLKFEEVDGVPKLNPVALVVAMLPPNNVLLGVVEVMDPNPNVAVLVVVGVLPKLNPGDAVEPKVKPDDIAGVPSDEEPKENPCVCGW